MGTQTGMLDSQEQSVQPTPSSQMTIIIRMPPQSQQIAPDIQLQGASGMSMPRKITSGTISAGTPVVMTDWNTDTNTVSVWWDPHAKDDLPVGVGVFGNPHRQRVAFVLQAWADKTQYDSMVAFARMLENRFMMMNWIVEEGWPKN